MFFNNNSLYIERLRGHLSSTDIECFLYTTLADAK